MENHYTDHLLGCHHLGHDSECACHDPDDDYYCYEYSEGITP